VNKKIDLVLFGAILPPLNFEITPGSFPLGLLALASALEQKGFSVEVISGAFRDAQEKLKKSLKKCRYLGVSSMTGPYLKMAIEVSKRTKRKYPHLPIIWGGVHATLLPEDTIAQDYVDIVVRGMGEETFCQLIEALDEKLPLNKIKGITYKDKGKIISNPDIEMPDINQFPSFNYNYFLPYKDKISALPYISSRGCPFGCTFCVASKLYERKYYCYPAERMYEEIRNLTRAFGCRRIAFWDDNLFVVKERIKKFCQLAIKNDLRIKWSGFCHCHLFLEYDDDLICLMKKAGVESISFGAESGSEKILASIKKGLKKEQILACVAKTAKFNIDADFTFMTGFPKETLDDFKQTLNIFKKMLKINPDVSIRLFAFTPYPKIPILEQEPKLAKYFPHTLEGWANLTYQNYIPQWISLKHKKLINDLVWMINFLSRKQRPRQKNPAMDFILYLYHLSAIFRLKNNLLFCAFEWKLFKLFYKTYTNTIQKRTAKWIN